MRTVTEMANAKLNLFLDIRGKRQDGYHEIRTVMHTVSLADRVSVSVAPAAVPSVAVEVRGEGNAAVPADGTNTAAIAARLFLSRCRLTDAVTVSMEKHIPVAAGLAGGSSDAAAVLRALNRLYRAPLSEPELLTLAAAVGSDVPYCLHGKTALCEGRGERLTRLCVPAVYRFVIAVAGESMSTPRAYTLLDALYGQFSTPRPAAREGYTRLLSALGKGAPLSFSLYNIFEPAVLPLCPGAEELRYRLRALGATAALMSGSGPSVFGVFPSADAAEAAAVTLRGEGVRAYAASSV